MRNKVFPITHKLHESVPGRVNRSVTITLSDGTTVLLRKTFRSNVLESRLKGRNGSGLNSG
jgi:hypothetical protein